MVFHNNPLETFFFKLSDIIYTKVGYALFLVFPFGHNSKYNFDECFLREPFIFTNIYQPDLRAFPCL